MSFKTSFGSKQPTLSSQNVLSLDVSVLEQPVLPMDVSVQQQPECAALGGVCSTYRAACATQGRVCSTAAYPGTWNWTCLTREVSGKQQLVLHQDVSVYNSLCCTLHLYLVLAHAVSA